jgi:hypothetical protein
MEDRPVGLSDSQRAVLYIGRDKCEKTFVDDVLLSVNPQLDLAAKVVDIARVGVNKGDRFGKFVRVLFDGSFFPFSPLCFDNICRQGNLWKRPSN